MQSFLLAFALLGAIVCSLMGIISLLAQALPYRCPRQERQSLLTFGVVCMLIALGCFIVGWVALQFTE